MKKLLLLLVILCSLLICSACFAEETHLDEIPMYGGDKITPYQKAQNDAFVKSTLEEAAKRRTTTREVV